MRMHAGKTAAKISISEKLPVLLHQGFPDKLIYPAVNNKH